MSANDETGQQIGMTMAAIDESGGANGEVAMNQAVEKAFKRYAPKDTVLPFWQRSLINEAQAASCFVASSFSSCNDNVVVHSFDNCTLLLAKFDGSVKFTWGGDSTDCELQSEGDTITREPNITVTGLRGAELAITNSGTGQKLTWNSGTGDDKVFKFSNSGIRRKFTSAGNVVVLDFTTSTTSDITVTGTKRSNRVLDGGELKVVNNKTDFSCNYTPDNVKWSSTCNCATSGTWTGTCSNDSETKLKITGCGKGDLTIDGDTSEVEFDHCIGF